MAKALAIVVVVGISASVGYGAVKPMVTAARPSESVQWGNQVFTDRDELSSWLEARGRSYREWARSHPDAASRLEDVAARANRRFVVVRLTLAALAVVLVIIAALPESLLRLARAPANLAEYRIELAMAGCGIAAGAAAAQLLSLAPDRLVP